jgi:hypothetical protein
MQIVGQLLESLVKYWPILAAGMAAVWAVWQYKDSRLHALRIQSMTLLFEELAKFDADHDIQNAVMILEDRSALRYDAIYEGDGTPVKIDPLPYPHDRLASEHCPIGKALQDMDKLLNALDRVVYAHTVLEILTAEDVDMFGWYFHTIHNTLRLRAYCEKNGYQKVAAFAAEREPSIPKV